MTLPPISEEQKRLVEESKREMNMMVSACAGSGKTTTCMYIAIGNPEKTILLLTYNAKLKMETRLRVAEAGLKNMEVHTYHSFAVRYGSPDACKDQGMLTMLKLQVDEMRKRMPKYDMVLIDEIQDMNPLYYRLVIRTLGDQGIRFIVMGDPNQSIYGFNRADARFLTMAEEVFPSERTWYRGRLSTTYRLTHSMARFLNVCCKGTDTIKTVRDGPRVVYMVQNSYKKDIFVYMIALLKKYRPDDIFVLAPSIKTASSPIRNMANSMTRRGIPIYVPTSDEERLDEDIMRGKVVFSTFHQVKGLERKVVLVYNFDKSYYVYYDTKATADRVPNALYVAITRAKERLVVVHDEKYGYLPCIYPEKLADTVEMIVSRPVVDEVHRGEKTDAKDFGVVDLVRHVPVDVIAACMDEIEVRNSRLPGDKNGVIHIPVKTRQKDLYESVSEITGTCMPCLFEWKITRKISMVEHLTKETMKKIRKRKQESVMRKTAGTEDMSDMYDRLRKDSEDVVEGLLRCATRWCSQKSGYQFKENQISRYDWVSKRDLETATERLGALFPGSSHPHLRFEYPVIHQLEEYNVRLIGFVDIVDISGGVLCEIKAVQSIDAEHILQAVVYMWLMTKIPGMVDIRKAFVMNLLDGQIRQFRTKTQGALERIVHLLVRHKKSVMEEVSSAQFVENCRIISQTKN